MYIMYRLIYDFNVSSYLGNLLYIWYTQLHTHLVVDPCIGESIARSLILILECNTCIPEEVEITAQSLIQIDSDLDIFRLCRNYFFSVL